MKDTPEKFPFDLRKSNDLPFLVGLINLSKGGKADLVIRYDGSGDDGSITSIAVRVGKKRLRLPAAMHEQIDAWTYELLGNSYPGWEIDDGSSGEITVDVQTRQVTHEHRWAEREERD